MYAVPAKMIACLLPMVEPGPDQFVIEAVTAAAVGPTSSS